MTQIREWPLAYRRLYRRARHQALLSQMTHDLCFDSEDNWSGEDRPRDIRAYWHSLTDTERAIQRLERTEAAIYMEFYDRVLSSIPKMASNNL